MILIARYLWIQMWVYNVVQKSCGFVVIGLNYSVDWGAGSKPESTACCTICRKTDCYILCDRPPVGPIIRPLLPEELFYLQGSDLSQMLPAEAWDRLPESFGSSKLLEFIGDGFNLRHVGANLIAGLMALPMPLK